MLALEAAAAALGATGGGESNSMGAVEGSIETRIQLWAARFYILLRMCCPSPSSDAKCAECALLFSGFFDGRQADIVHDINTENNTIMNYV